MVLMLCNKCMFLAVYISFFFAFCILKKRGLIGGLRGKKETIRSEKKAKKMENRKKKELAGHPVLVVILIN